MMLSDRSALTPCVTTQLSQGTEGHGLSPGMLAMYKAPQWENGETANNKRGREASGEVDWGGRLALRSPIFHSRAE